MIKYKYNYNLIYINYLIKIIKKYFILFYIN